MKDLKITKDSLVKELEEFISVKKSISYEYVKLAKPFFAGLERIRHLHGSEQWKIEAEEILRSHETFTSLMEKVEKSVDNEIERITKEIESLKQIKE